MTDADLLSIYDGQHLVPDPHLAGLRAVAAAAVERERARSARAISAQPAAEPVCPHIRSSGTTHWCALAEPQIDGYPLYSALPPAARPAAEPVAWLHAKVVDSYDRPDLGYETCAPTDPGAFPVYAVPQPSAEPALVEAARRALRDDDERLLRAIISAADGRRVMYSEMDERGYELARTVLAVVRDALAAHDKAGGGEGGR